MFRKKIKLSIIDKEWKVIQDKVLMTVIPRANELLYLDDVYYTVINVINTINVNQPIILIVEKINNI